MPIFLKYKIEEQIAPLLRRTVPLKSGGSISIDPTEALVAIDVNTGRFTRVKDPEESTLITNLEAADEIARQLRLRDLGGLIVIDFIDMKSQKNRLQVERHLRNAFKNDKANIEITRISQFGLLEMSRERLRTPLVDVSQTQCACCGGTGSLKSREAIALSVLTAIFDKASAGNCSEIKVWVSEDAAAYLLNNKRSDLVSIEQQFSTRIDVLAEKLSPVDSHRIETKPKA
jgi:ribonuclease E